MPGAIDTEESHVTAVGSGLTEEEIDEIAEGLRDSFIGLEEIHDDVEILTGRRIQKLC